VTEAGRDRKQRNWQGGKGGRTRRSERIRETSGEETGRKDKVECEKAREHQAAITGA